MVSDIISGLSLREAGRGFLISLRASGHYSDRYLEGLEEAIARFSVYSEGVGLRGVSDITIERLEEYLTYLRNRPYRFKDGNGRKLSQWSVSSHYRRLTRFCNWLVERGHLGKNPMEAIPSPRVRERTIGTVSERQKIDLLTITDPKDSRTPGERFRDTRNQALLYLLFDTPGRRNELAKIQVSDIDFDTNMVKVLGKGRKDRRMPLGSTAINALTSYLQLRDQVTSERQDALWVSEHGDPVRPDWLYLTIKRLGERAGIKGLHPHMFRHTYVMSTLIDHMPQRVLEIIGGWKRIPDTYLRSISEEQAAQMHRMVSPGDKLRNRRRQGNGQGKL